MQKITSDRWTVQALATFTLWNWGNTAFKVGENKVKVTQAEDTKNQTIDSITLEVKNDYLNMQVAEKNISTAEKSIEQAEENLRMNEERYKYQVATQTDVVNAVTLLAQARTNYYGALSDFNVAKAQLDEGHWHCRDGRDALRHIYRPLLHPAILCPYIPRVQGEATATNA